jgi:hypothetical protein
MPQKKFVIAATPEEKSFKKRVQDILITLKCGWNILVQDESIFVHDSGIKKK